MSSSYDRRSRDDARRRLNTSRTNNNWADEGEAWDTGESVRRRSIERGSRQRPADGTDRAPNVRTGGQQTSADAHVPRRAKTAAANAHVRVRRVAPFSLSATSAAPPRSTRLVAMSAGRARAAVPARRFPNAFRASGRSADPTNGAVPRNAGARVVSSSSKCASVECSWWRA